MKQMSIFDNDNPSKNSELVDELVKKIKNSFSDSDLAKNIVCDVLAKGEISFKVKNQLIAKINANRTNMAINRKYIDIFPAAIDNGKELINQKIANLDDVINYSSQIEKIVAMITLSNNGIGFSCCSRYLECSNAKQCVNPNKAFALACMYKKNLDAGKIFYGENKTI